MGISFCRVGFKHFYVTRTKVYICLFDFEDRKNQTKNDQLIAVRETFDQYNLISALHSFHSLKDQNYKNILPPLTLLSENELKELMKKLNVLKFRLEKNKAA